MTSRTVLTSVALVGALFCTAGCTSDNEAETGESATGESGDSQSSGPAEGEEGPKDADVLARFDGEYEEVIKPFGVLDRGMRGGKGMRQLPEGQIRQFWNGTDKLYEILTQLQDTADPGAKAAFKKLEEHEAKVDQLIEASGSQAVAVRILGETKMDAAGVTEDNELSGIATNCLANTDWDVGQVKRMLINYDRNQDTRRFWNNLGQWQDWAWEEFQVTTAEKVGDKFFLRTYEFKNYSKGGPKTGEWLIATRVSSKRILEENIGG